MSEAVRHIGKFSISLIGATLAAIILHYVTGDPFDLYSAVAIFAMWEATRP